MSNKLRSIKMNDNLAFRPKVSNYFTVSPSRSAVKHSLNLLLQDIWRKI